MMKRIMLLALVTLVGLLLAACIAPPPKADGAPAAPANPTAAATPATTIACTGIPTIAQTEGPMYVADPPQRTDLRSDPRNVGGEPLLLTGYAVNTQCQPLANVRVDIWHTDAQGEYDLSPVYTSRGYTLTAADGSFRFETVFPVIYVGRTAHIHVKLTPPAGATLTTQLYFPNEATNSGDAIFEPSLLVTLAESSASQEASYTFVLDE